MGKLCISSQLQCRPTWVIYRHYISLKNNGPGHEPKWLAILHEFETSHNHKCYMVRQRDAHSGQYEDQSSDNMLTNPLTPPYGECGYANLKSHVIWIRSHVLEREGGGVLKLA